MAQFTNQAQLSYNNTVVNSNVTVGELLEVLSADKNAVVEAYTNGENTTYVISLVNSGNTTLTGVTVSDDLGTYPFGATTVTPLSYVPGSVQLYTNGVLQAQPTAVAGPPLVFNNLTVPAGGNIVLIYETTANSYAPLGTGATITNTATITGAGIATPILATETIDFLATPQLSITKSLEPSTVTENGTLTYQFVIQNYGATEAIATDNVAIADTFNPILSDIVVTLDGVTWAEGTNYTYNTATGLFNTVPGQITVPAATYAQDPTTGVWVTTPGVAILTVRGTV